MNIIGNLIFHCNNSTQIEHSSQFVKARQPRRVVVYLMQNLCLRGRPLPIIFARIVRPMNVLKTLSLTVFTQRNIVADFLQAKCDFRWKTAVLRFWAPFGGLGQRTMFIFGLIGKRVVDFLLVLIELFSLGVTAEALRAKKKPNGDFAVTQNVR